MDESVLRIEEAVNETCPWSGKPIAADSLTRYAGAVVGFCNPGCRDKFEAATALFDAAVTAGPTLAAMAGRAPAAATLDEATLVVIDAQEEYRSGALGLAGVAGAVARLERLLGAARDAGTPVVHVVHRGRPGGLFDPAGPGGGILPELAPRAGEPVVAKTLPNAFTGTELAERLREAGRPAVLLAGFMTHNCVEATARAALDRGMPAAVVADATTTRALPDPLGGPALTAEEVQRASLAGLADRTAAITTVAEVLAHHAA
jgi:nicotinamidase-related amidase